MKRDTMELILSEEITTERILSVEARKHEETQGIVVGLTLDNGKYATFLIKDDAELLRLLRLVTEHQAKMNELHKVGINVKIELSEDYEYIYDYLDKGLTWDEIIAQHNEDTV